MNQSNSVNPERRKSPRSLLETIEEYTVPLDEIFDRLRALEIGETKLLTLLKVGASSIVLVWGFSSYFIVDRLEDIKATGVEVIQLKSTVNLLEYQRGEQDRFNLKIIENEEEEHEETKIKFENLSKRIDAIYKRGE